MPIKVREGGAWVQVSDGANGASFVTGMIMMFSGTTAPSGWVLCDDSAAAQAANAPDLRDRFIVGAGSGYTVDATGGSADAVVVSHNHGITEPNGGQGHSHSVNINVYQAGQGSNAPTDMANRFGNTESGRSTTGITINDEGVSGTNKNLPPYYALAFIMKT